MHESPLLISYGGGTNSVAMLVGLADLGERPDAIVFSDTGGEKPETYAHIETMDAWCRGRGWPGITVVRYAYASGEVETLEANCLKNRRMPSIAYGFKTCSERWKRRPQERWAATWDVAAAAWAGGSQVVKCIGYDADEPERKARADAVRRGPQDLRRYALRYPLVEWGWGRPECLEAIDRAGLPRPGKSACFFCPSSKPAEIIELADRHPDLLARALVMEDGAERSDGSSIVGLGRYFRWADVVAGDRAQCKLFAPPTETPCDCYDGDGDE